MEGLKLRVLLLLAAFGASLFLLGFSGAPGGPSLPDLDEGFTDHAASAILTRTRNIMRNLEEDEEHMRSDQHRNQQKTKVEEDLNLEDYRPIDPSPATKASVRHGPIQHGTPVNPYVIPKPPPPQPPSRP